VRKIIIEIGAELKKKFLRAANGVSRRIIEIVMPGSH
jgi:hypothetical protein